MLVKMKRERANNSKMYWFPPNWWLIARWWRFGICEIHFFQNIDKKHIKLSQAKMVVIMKRERAKNSKEKRHFHFSSSYITFWYKAKATTAFLGWDKIHTSDTNSTFNMEGKTQTDSTLPSLNDKNDRSSARINDVRRFANIVVDTATGRRTFTAM